jgi:aspartyl-tRNA(Asn)/glutamyl-tRNA(Gln) amidotransferase subunit C
MDIHKIAHLARLELTAAEIETYGGQLEQILHHIEQLKGINVEGIEATAHAAPIFDRYREDELQPGHTLSPEAALSNAPASAHDQFKMPKVIE